ncbi:MBL fold metallo-hydrolase, partial [Aduncisulcus paluster]
MKYTQLRHATGILTYGGLDILIDPMLAPQGANPPVMNSWNDRRNPLIPFPIPLDAFQAPDHCLVTHLHPDHFDTYAADILPKTTALICQSDDAEKFEQMGFLHIYSIESTILLNETIQIQKVEGRHGYGQTAQAMGHSPGYILSADSEPTLYITGDTIFYESVEETLRRHQPDVILAFAGCAQFSDDFLDKGPITLSPEDLESIHRIVPDAKIICTHMDSINHCKVDRNMLSDY